MLLALFLLLMAHSIKAFYNKAHVELRQRATEVSKLDNFSTRDDNHSIECATIFDK